MAQNAVSKYQIAFHPVQSKSFKLKHINFKLKVTFKNRGMDRQQIQGADIWIEYS